MAQEVFRDMAVSDEARLERMKAEVMTSSLYNEDLIELAEETVNEVSGR